MKEMLRNWQITVTAILLTGMFAGSNVLASNWWETIKIKGDFRYRHEMIDKEGKDVRHRQRIRARLGVFGEVSEYTKVGIRLASGSDDPVSTNQTLDGAFSTKNIGIDLAYFATGFKGVEGLTIVGGKMKNPFFRPGKSELIWDGDLNPEGGAATFQKTTDNFVLTLTGAGFWINERSSSDDSYVASGQAVGCLYFNEKESKLTFGGSIFNYVNSRGYEPFFDHEDPMGNTTVLFGDDGDTVLHYANDYELIELFGEVNHKFQNTPVTVIGDFVTNNAADSLNTGWLVGLRVGKAKKPGSWEFRYNYRNIEADAVPGIFTDSDFRGGGTDAKGHEIGGAVQLAANTAFKATYFSNEIGLEETETDDFRRLQVDLQFKF
ncbi:MAG: putative porin [candidate division Zixibacteria bacterium]|nr:putative porin [candidate division Zixibacteria bacterium]